MPLEAPCSHSSVVIIGDLFRWHHDFQLRRTKSEGDIDCCVTLAGGRQADPIEVSKDLETWWSSLRDHATEEEIVKDVRDTTADVGRDQPYNLKRQRRSSRRICSSTSSDDAGVNRGKLSWPVTYVDVPEIPTNTSTHSIDSKTDHSDNRSHESGENLYRNMLNCLMKFRGSGLIKSPQKSKSALNVVCARGACCAVPWLEKAYLKAKLSATKIDQETQTELSIGVSCSVRKKGNTVIEQGSFMPCQPKDITGTTLTNLSSVTAHQTDAKISQSETLNLGHRVSEPISCPAFKKGSVNRPQVSKPVLSIADLQRLSYQLNPSSDTESTQEVRSLGINLRYDLNSPEQSKLSRHSRVQPSHNAPKTLNTNKEQDTISSIESDDPFSRTETLCTRMNKSQLSQAPGNSQPRKPSKGHMFKQLVQGIDTATSTSSAPEPISTTSPKDTFGRTEPAPTRVVSRCSSYICNTYVNNADPNAPDSVYAKVHLHNRGSGTCGEPAKPHGNATKLDLHNTNRRHGTEEARFSNEVALEQLGHSQSTLADLKSNCRSKNRSRSTSAISTVSQTTDRNQSVNAAKQFSSVILKLNSEKIRRVSDDDDTTSFYTATDCASCSY